MKKIFSFLLLAISMGIISTGCGGGSMSNASPKEVLVAFFEKLSKKDIDGATKLATKDSKSTMEMMKKGLEMADKMKDQIKDAKEDPTEEFKNMEVGDAKINGDVATVAVRNKKKDQEVEFPLKKEDGAWKVDFSMTTLMKMGMDEKNKRAGEMGNNDPMSGMEGMDSASIQKGLEVMDSALKTVDPKKLEETMKALEKLKQPQ
jgi:hypothetical protein